VVRLIHDLAVPSGVSDLIHHVGRNSLDLLVNNAGIAIVKPFCEITSLEWEQTVGVNITGGVRALSSRGRHAGEYQYFELGWKSLIR
jgi:NAD(P)-dependent dehydrogenase (short-subunit alcohol dehydrogenase family)